MNDQSQSAKRSKFTPMFWLVIIFEFFERGSYYGMMSVLSVYFTDYLLFSKEGVGVIKSVIQPILYFLPILAGALADRFGYRKALTIAFALMGGGYFLTSQVTTYSAVFMALVVMAIGAGVFKPIISGTIARTTDESNSTVGFGIYYWSINLGAFLFPLILVPWLKSISWPLVIVMAAIGTGIMVIPTLLFFRDPVVSKPDETGTEAEKPPRKNLVRTMADAFEIIYSPLVLIASCLGQGGWRRIVTGIISLIFLVLAIGNYLQPRETLIHVTAVPEDVAGVRILVEMDRNQSSDQSYNYAHGDVELPLPLMLEYLKESPDMVKLSSYWQTAMGASHENFTLDGKWLNQVGNLLSERISNGIEPGQPLWLVVHKPEELLREVGEYTKGINKDSLGDDLKRILLRTGGNPSIEMRYADIGESSMKFNNAAVPAPVLMLNDHASSQPSADEILAVISENPAWQGVTSEEVKKALDKLPYRPFLWLFIGLIYVTGLMIMGLKKKLTTPAVSSGKLMLAFAVILPFIIWLIPDLTLFSKVLCSIIYLTLLALFLIDTDNTPLFKDHFKFLLLIFIYSGFWVLYFQMFDSVLWYVQAYVDASPLDGMVNSILAGLGMGWRWHFDVEHVTVINAGTIIALQLVVSKIVEKTKALPTMIFGILLGTIGMAILAVSTHIWVFFIGTVVFSVGEMTAHPKFISYIGLTAPQARKAMYMGYIFLYGVIGSSIGGVLGANLYVHFVDHLNQPRLLWLIFASIGVVTIVCLLVYNRFLSFEKKSTQ